MNDKQIRNIVREYMEKMVIEQDIEISPYTPEEEKFLAKFPELKTTSIGIIYSKDTTGVREFLNRSGKDFNLTPNILHSLLKKGTVSIVPYGGYARNEDYTLQLNIPLEDLEGLSSGPAETDQDKAIATEESAESSQDLAKLLVTEQKRHTQSRVYTGKSRTLKRLPKGYINYLERIIQILGSKLKNEREREQLVADILDNLAHNFGLTPKQVYRSFIYYRSQNRLANIVRESVGLNEQGGPKPVEIPLSANFDSGKYKELPSNFKQELNNALQGKIAKFLETYKDNQINVTIEAGESQVTNFDNEVSPKKEVEPGYLSQKRGETLKTFLTDALTGLAKEGLITKVPTIDIKTVIGPTPYKKGSDDLNDPTKQKKYKEEQYVKLIISVSGKKHQCLINLKIQVAYDPSRKGGHSCDQAIFEIKANGISLGIVNLNNSAKDAMDNGPLPGYAEYMNTLPKYSRKNRDDISYNQIEPKLVKYAIDNFNNPRINRNPDKYYEFSNKEQQKILKDLFTKYAKEIDPNFETGVGSNSANGVISLRIKPIRLTTPEVSYNVPQNAVGGQERYTDGQEGGARAQTFILDDALAKQIQGDNDQIVLTIKPLVENKGTYYMFYNYVKALSSNEKTRKQAGSHSDVPLVTITDANDKQIYSDFPDAGLERGEMTEVTLITLDKCGYPVKLA